jgi:hypothetical protein
MIRLERIKREAFERGAHEVLEKVQGIIGTRFERYAEKHATLNTLARIVRPLMRTAEPLALDGTIVRPRLPIPLVATIGRSVSFDGWAVKLIWYGDDSHSDRCYEYNFDMLHHLPRERVAEFVMDVMRHALFDVFMHVTNEFNAEITKALLEKARLA